LILGILGTFHFNKGDFSQVKRDLRLNLKEIIRLNQKRASEVSDRKTFFFVRPIYKRRAYEKCNPFFRFFSSLAIRWEFRA
jgi:hypothetical protein